MNDDIPLVQDRKRDAAAAGSVIGAVLASSCCIGPLLLITLGASGAWIGNLTAMQAYQPVFVTVTLAFLGFGFWRVYGKSRQPCNEGSYCVTPTTNRVVKSALWIATVLVVIALTTDQWAPLFY